MTSPIKCNTPYAWCLAKKITVFIGIVLLLEMLYFLKTASSSLEITMLCIFVFALISNMPIFYKLYKTSE